SLIGSFFFLNIFGYSINLLTLFAMVLAIGIVVDDAIIVVEIIHAKLEEGAESGIEAAVDGMSEIAGAIVSITLVMSAIFVPVTFISGSTGVFFQQFGITLAVAIIISARSEEHTSELQSRFDLVAFHSFPTRRSSDLYSR